MLVFLDREGLEASLVQRSGAAAVVMGVPAHSMGQGQPVQKVGKFPVLTRPKNQMEVVWHEAVGQQACGDVVFGLPEASFKGGIVAFFVEDGGASDSAVEGVVDITAGGNARSSWHAPTLRLPSLPGKIYESRPLFFLRLFEEVLR
jgi:hypothetical protein